MIVLVNSMILPLKALADVATKTLVPLFAKSIKMTRSAKNMLASMGGSQALADVKMKHHVKITALKINRIQRANNLPVSTVVCKKVLEDVRMKLPARPIVKAIRRMVNVQNMPVNMEDLAVLEDVRMRLLVHLTVSQTLKIQPAPRMLVNTAEERNNHEEFA